MHRAAAYGNAQHIETLIQWHKPLLDSRTKRTYWSPLFCAVHFGNIETFNELRKYLSEFLELKDVRGWSLLHVAINAQKIETMKLLIEMGADPHSKSLPTKSCVPPQLKGLAATPGDIACIKGWSTLKAYADALVETGYHDVVVHRDEKDAFHDILWDAKAYFL